MQASNFVDKRFEQASNLIHISFLQDAVRSKVAPQSRNIDRRYHPRPRRSPFAPTRLQNKTTFGETSGWPSQVRHTRTLKCNQGASAFPLPCHLPLGTPVTATPEVPQP